MIDAVVFDMDGVLIDARDWHYEALNRALGVFGFKISREDHTTRYDGLPTMKKLQMLSADRTLPKALHPFINELKQDYTVDLIQANCRPTFAHQYALMKLRERGFKLGVASNSIRTTVDLMLAKADIAQYFHVTLAASEIERPKPNPDIYQRIVAALGTSPERTLVIEDNKNGITAARAAGCEVLEVRSPVDVHWTRILDKIERLNAGKTR